MPERTASTASPGLAEIFRPGAIVVGLNSRTKPGAIQELVHRLSELGHLDADGAQAVVEGVCAQEKRASTAVYDGMAFPHLRSGLAERFVGALAIDPGGIPFDSVGGGPVYSIFLLLAPLEKREGLYGVLGRLVAIGRDKSRRAQLRGCRTPEAAHDFLQEMDREAGG
jgi:mannitol/fructose-specific phosphotransferase system IIA component (Ntr-type)